MKYNNLLDGNNKVQPLRVVSKTKGKKDISGK